MIEDNAIASAKDFKYNLKVNKANHNQASNRLTNMVNSNLSFDEVLNNVESLTIEDQDLLFEIIQKRRTEARREEIALNANETIKSFQNKTANIGDLASLKADLLEEE